MDFSKSVMDKMIAIEILRKQGVSDPMAILAIRGFLGENKRGVYDDLICLVGEQTFMPCIGNTDPSKSYPGVAVLNPGIWEYRIGTHGISKPKEKQYEALVQAAPVTVTRDDKGEDTGWFGINLHRGGNYETSSLGCLTIKPQDWDDFLDLTKTKMTEFGMKEIKLCLILAQNLT